MILLEKNLTSKMYNRNNIHTIYRLVHKGNQEGFHYEMCVKNFNATVLDKALSNLSRVILLWGGINLIDITLWNQVIDESLDYIEYKLRDVRNPTHVDFLNECEARFRVAQFALSTIRNYL